MKMKSAGAVIACSLFSSQVTAIEIIGSLWKGEGEFGYVATSGNTETENLKAKLGLVNDREKWRHSATLEALNESDSETTTAERYAAIWQSDYKMGEFDYLFGRLEYETDKFSGYDYRTSEVLGYGRRVLKRENMTLDLEAGPGARQSKLENGDSESEAILRLAGKYIWKISDHAKFTQDLSFDIGEEATISKSVSALQSNVIGNLAMRLSYTVENTSEVPVGVDKTDTQTALSLVYEF